jgi:predicted nucleic acid-binding protein
VIFVDTSAWIEFLRDTRSEVCALVEESLAGEAAICDAVRMEVLAASI